MPNVLPTIPNDPPQGIQALLDKVYLWNPDAANNLITRINELLKEIEETSVAVSSVNGQTGEVVLTAEDINVSFAEEEETIQTAISTLKEDQGDLGDQVSTIEGKIPESASTENPLATKQDLNGYLPATGGTGVGLYTFRTLLPSKYEVASAIRLVPYLADGTELRPARIRLGDGYFRIGGDTYIALSYASKYLRPDTNNQWNLGESGYSWAKVYTAKINNGADIAIPTTGGTVALAEDIAESVTTKDLTVGTDEGTLNIGITAGVATIATNNGLDIVSQTKFDTAPTTDDATAWADVNATALVTKAQVTAALSTAGGGTSVTIRNWA